MPSMAGGLAASLKNLMALTELEESVTEMTDAVKVMLSHAPATCNRMPISAI
jgi:hypothetical protein